MLSGTAQENTPRPRPPRTGTRSRSYLKSRDPNVLYRPSSPSPSSATLHEGKASTLHDEKASLHPDQQPSQHQHQYHQQHQDHQQLQHPQPAGACHALGAAIHLDQDLDLDLPPELTAALSSADRWSPSLVPNHGQMTNASPDPGYNGPKWGRGATRSSPTPSSDVTLHPSPRPSMVPLSASSPQDFNLQRRGSHTDMLTETLHAVAGRPVQEVDPGEELDRAWLCGLPREELEALLFQANAVIQERERDLGIAAAIGQALLQKNTSLRRKHEEVMDRFHATVDLNNAEYQDGDQEARTEEDHAGEEDADTSDPPMYSPPPDNAERSASIGEATPITDDTPMPTPRIAADYFQYTPHEGDTQHTHLPLSPSQNSFQHKAGSIPFSSSIEGTSFAEAMIPSTSGLISSPSDSTIHSDSNFSPESHPRHRQRHQITMQASMTQKHLTALSAQNETLLGQMAALQEEAEEAKREGSRRLRRLNREIKGLQLELENVTERNQALESTTRAPKKVWSRHELAEERQGSPAANKSPPHVVQSSSVQSSRRPAASLHVSTSSESLSNSLHALLRESPADDGGSIEQHSVVARLLAKVKELEQTNAALEAARRDRDGRLGAALKEGTKITDEYDAVLHAHESEMSFVIEAGERRGAGGHEDFDGSANSHSQLTSPESPHRSHHTTTRALGNRWQVETRRTIRKALRRRRTAQEIWGSPARSEVDGLPPSISDSSISSMLSTSTLSSPFSSPRKARRKKSALSLGRPRILITPSMEDLAAKSREQAEGWEDRDDPTEHGTSPRSLACPSRSPRSRSLDPSDAHTIVKRASDGALRARRQREASNEDGVSTSTPVLPSPGASPAWHAHATARATRPRSPSHGQDSERSAACGMPSLASELGSLLDGDDDDDDTEVDPTNDSNNTSLLHLYYDGDGTMTSCGRGDGSGASTHSTSAHTHKNQRSSRPTLRSQVSCESIAVSDIANIRCDEDVKLHEDASQLLLLDRSTRDISSIDEQLAHRVVSREGDWFYSVVKTNVGNSTRTTLEDSDDDRVIASGALRDRKEPHEEQYSLLERVIYDHPVRWADDDDYGAPLKESEARQLGLLGTSATVAPISALVRRSTLARGLLSWAGLPTGQSATVRERARPKSRNVSLILSSEQLEEEERREALLRRKYHRALRLRGIETGGHFIDDDAHGRVSLEGPDEEGEDALLEEEVNARAWALSNATGTGRRYGYALRPQGTQNHRAHDQSHGHEEAGCQVDNSPSTGATPSSSTSSIISTLTQRSSRRRHGAAGVSDLVKLNVSLATLHELVAWAWLVCVLILAFFVSASRGEVSPRRILGTGETTRRRNRSVINARTTSRSGKEKETSRGDGNSSSGEPMRSPLERGAMHPVREGERGQAATGGVQRRLR